MLSFITWLNSELSGIDSELMHTPNIKVHEYDLSIGEITGIETRKLYALSVRIEEDLRLLQEAAEQENIHQEIRGDGIYREHDPATCGYCTIKRAEASLSQKKAAVDAILWSCILEELPEEKKVQIQKLLGTSNSCEICEDWKIVIRSVPIVYCLI